LVGPVDKAVSTAVQEEEKCVLKCPVYILDWKIESKTEDGRTVDGISLDEDNVAVSRRLCKLAAVAPLVHHQWNPALQ
jgi:hypothetical protein